MTAHPERWTEEDAAPDPRETGPWQMVSCADCHRVYQCRPMDDHYLRATDPEGSPRVCERCLIVGAPKETTP